MAPHSSTLAWKIPWTEEPRRLQSMGSLRVGHHWATSLSLLTLMHWRRKWQPTPVFLPGESRGWGSLVGCRLWGRTEPETTKVTAAAAASPSLRRLWVISAAAAKSLQSCPTLCDSTDGSPPGSPDPGILQARTLEWVAMSFSNAWKWKWSSSVVSKWMTSIPAWELTWMSGWHSDGLTSL